MEAVGHLIGWSLVALALGGVVFTLTAAMLAGSPKHAPRPGGGSLPAVTLLKPLYLAEPGLEQNLRSFFLQNYAAPLQIVFGVRNYADPALLIVEKLKRSFPDADIEVVVEAKLSGTNPKISNLINMQSRAKHDVLVMSDSDIRVRPDYVRQLMAAMNEPGVGAVTCLYTGRPVGSVWSTLAAMGIDYQFRPNAIVGIAAGLAKPCFGSTIALRRQTLEEIGGFEAFSDVLADDYELGRAVRSKGYRLAVSGWTVEHICSQESAQDLFEQEVRWAKTISMLDRPGYLGSLVTFPFSLSILAMLFLGVTWTGLAVVAATFFARLLLALRSRHSLRSYAGPLWLLPLRDVLSFGVFVASFFGKSVRWRGTRYLTSPDGALAQY